MVMAVPTRSLDVVVDIVSQFPQGIEAVGDVVCGRMSKSETVTFVQRYAEVRVPAQDRARLVEVIETQLLSLHDGSIARYRLRPSQYQAWKEVWK